MRRDAWRFFRMFPYKPTKRRQRPRNQLIFNQFLVRPAGIEPATPAFGGLQIAARSALLHGRLVLYPLSYGTNLGHSRHGGKKMGTIVKRVGVRNIKWQAKIRRSGYPTQSRVFKTKKEAQQWTDEVERNMDNGTFRICDAPEITIMKEALERYRDQVSVKKKGSEGEIIRINAMLRTKYAQYSLVHFTRHIAAQWRDSRLKKVSGSTVNREMNLFGHVIEKARREWGVELPENPIREIERPRSAPPRERRLRAGEEERLLAAAGEARTPYQQPIIVLAIETAMRRAELINLRWEFIDIPQRRIHLIESESFSIKNGTSRVVPLSRRAIGVLEAYQPNEKKRQGLVFEGLTAEALKQAFGKTVARAGLENFRLHDLRHEATSRFFEKGLSIAEAKSITGHKSMSSLERYVHINAAGLAAKLD